MTKEDMILDFCRRIEEKQDAQAQRIEGVVSLLAAHAVRISEVEAAGGRARDRWTKHEDEHKRIGGRILGILIAAVTGLVAAIWGIMREKP